MQDDIERRAFNVDGCHTVGARLHGSRLRRASGSHHPGGLSTTSSSITLNIFLDHSLLEVFTSTGEVLSTRCVICSCPPAALLTWLSTRMSCLHACTDEQGNHRILNLDIFTIKFHYEEWLLHAYTHTCKCDVVAVSLLMCQVFKVVFDWREYCWKVHVHMIPPCCLLSLCMGNGTSS